MVFSSQRRRRRKCSRLPVVLLPPAALAGERIVAAGGVVVASLDSGKRVASTAAVHKPCKCSEEHVVTASSVVVSSLATGERVFGATSIRVASLDARERVAVSGAVRKASIDSQRTYSRNSPAKLFAPAPTPTNKLLSAGLPMLRTLLPPIWYVIEVLIFAGDIERRYRVGVQDTYRPSTIGRGLVNSGVTDEDVGWAGTSEMGFGRAGRSGS